MSEITLEMIEERIKQYEADIEKMKVTLQAYDGALQDAHYWLDTLKGGLVVQGIQELNGN